MPERPTFLIHASVAVIDGDRILLVQEEKPDCRGQWNLPGGHVDHNESLIPAAQRELLEETGLRLNLDGLVGIYQTPRSIRFVFRATATDQQPIAGDEIVAVHSVPLAGVLDMND